MYLSKKDFKPDWVTNNALKYNKKLFNIVDFYLFKNPFKNTSSRGISLEEFGWKTENYKEMFKYMIYKVNLKKDRDIMTVSKEDISGGLKTLGLNGEFHKNLQSTKICYIKNSNDIEDLMYYIRCSIAHGRFSILENSEKKLYVMENIKKDKDKFIIKARMLIEEKVLLKWKDIILAGCNSMNNEIKIIEKKTQGENIKICT